VENEIKWIQYDMNKKVLVIDDDQNIVEIMRVILEDEGYSVISLEQDEDIENLILKTQPDLILLDVWIWGRDGKEIAQFVRKTHSLAHIPIIMVSAKNDLADVAAQADVNEFISKPFDINDLLASAQKYLNLPS
jgi:DNA-binding response OmpR family regulator